MLAKRLSLEGGGFGVPHRLEKGTSANKDVGPQRGMNERNILYKGVETSP